VYIFIFYIQVKSSPILD